MDDKKGKAASELLGVLSKEQRSPEEEEPSALAYLAVDQALREADKLRRSRRERTQFAVFAMAASAISFLVAYTGAIGFGIFMIAAQALAFLVLPFIGLAALRKKLKEEYEWTA